MGLRVLGVVLALAATARADRLSPADLARKNEGGYVTGLPLASYSTDLGFGGGARVYYYWNGHRDDGLFAITPYRFRMFLQAFATTRGVQFHWLDFDVPKVGGSPYRLRGQLIYARNLNSNYFGLGDRSLRALRFPGSPAFDNYTDYAAAQEQIVGGETFAKYDQYDLLKPSGIASVERGFDDGHVRVLAGLGFSYARIRDYTGKTVDATGGEATEAQTRLDADCAAQLIVGCGGGRDDYLRFGIAYDTRDYEPDPNRGVFLDAALDVGTVALGSEYDYVRFLVAARNYYSPIPDRADLVIATRGTFEWQSSGTPFFSMDSLPFTEDPRNGLGGHRTLRGYRQDRFVGPVMALVNQEVRWTFWRTTLWRQKLAFIAVPFLDLGRPFDSLSELSLRRWRASYGGAMRISWNLATVITVDYGVSPEDAGLYINFNHIF
jgi:hypothetical protein